MPTVYRQVKCAMTEGFINLKCADERYCVMSIAVSSVPYLICAVHLWL